MRSTRTVVEYEAMAMMLGYEQYDANIHAFVKDVDHRVFPRYVDADTLQVIRWNEMNTRHEQVFNRELGAVDYNMALEIEKRNASFKEI